MRDHNLEQKAIVRAHEMRAIFGGTYAVYKDGRKYHCGPFQSGVFGMVYATI